MEGKRTTSQRRKKMSLQKHGLLPIPEATSRIAHRAFPKGTLAMRLRDALGPIYQESDFVHLFAKRGRGAQDPRMLALVTVLQALEGLTDRQAAQAVAGRIDWKYALSLSLEEQGFDFSILSDFRARLIEAGASEVLLEPILRVCREQGFLSAGGKQRSDSTAVLAAVRRLSSLESVGESMRAALNALCQQDEEWVLCVLDAGWLDRYVHRFELARFPKEESERKRLREQVGADVHRLLGCLDQPQTPKGLSELPEISLLRQIFAQHYQMKGERVSWRDGPSCKNAERIVSPYDQEARASRKREVDWLGYKVHVSETCDQQPDRPHLVIGVWTTVATQPDSTMLSPILQCLQERGLAAQEHLVDAGYTSASVVSTQQALGTQVLGPLRASTSWQARQGQGYACGDFQINWQEQRARCPQGQTSMSWQEKVDQRGRSSVVIRFATATCRACPVRPLCTQQPAAGRWLTIQPQAQHDLLSQQREAQSSASWQQEYGRRAGIEGTISQGVRTLGMRRSRSPGLACAHFQQVQVAAALNLLRLDSFLLRRSQGLPARPDPWQSPLARLKKRVAS
jgi:transposase